MNEQICGLCLRTPMDNFPTLEDHLKDTLDDLLSKSVLNISWQHMVCNECVDNLQKFYNFKQSFVDILDKTSQGSDWERDASLDQKEIENKHIESEHDVKNLTTCSYCTKSTPNLCCIPLNELKKNTCVVNMLQKHIPKLNLNNMEHIVSCETCHQSLHRIIRFITNCFDVKEKIGKYIEIIDDKGQVDLRKVQAFILGREHKVDLVSVIKFDESDTESEDDVTMGYTLTRKDPPEQIMIKCKMCTFQTLYGSSMRRHMRTHVAKNYVCKVCEYETTDILCIWGHNLIHIDPSELTMPKCECISETQFETCPVEHLWALESPIERPWNKCDVCTYQTKYEEYLKYHMLIHNDRSEKGKFKCKECPFETVRKYYLIRHMKSHKDPTVKTIYKCRMCLLEAKSRQCLKQHMLNHRNPAKLHKCSQCGFHTKSYLKTHSVIDKDPSKVIWYKCELCEFETKHKLSLKGHTLTHRDPSKKKWRKCFECVFEALSEKSLRRHLMSHNKKPKKIPMYKCEMCLFETELSTMLERHRILSHLVDVRDVRPKIAVSGHDDLQVASHKYYYYN